jgi:hypothetical protein
VLWPDSDGSPSDDVAPCDDESSLPDDDVASEDSVVVREEELLVSPDWESADWGIRVELSEVLR